MCPAPVKTHSVEIEAPDGAAAVALERRLTEAARPAMCREGRWVVDIPAARDLVRLEGEVRTWLRDIGAAETSLSVDGSRTRLRAVPHRGTHRNFIG